MINGFRKALNRKKKKSLKEYRESYRKKFFESPHHQWLANDRATRRAMNLLIDSFDRKTIQLLERERELILIKANGRLSCAIAGAPDQIMIILYPDLVRLLRSGNPLNGVAVLAHELGHLVNDHSVRKISTIEAQYEADAFAHRLGLGEELLSVLSDYDHGRECRLRIQRLRTLLAQKAA